MSALADSSKSWHIVLRCTICGPLGLLFNAVSIFSNFRKVANSVKIKPTRKIPDIQYNIKNILAHRSYCSEHVFQKMSLQPLLAGLQSNSGLLIDDVRLSVCPFVILIWLTLVNLCILVWNLLCHTIFSGFLLDLGPSRYFFSSH